MLEQAHDHPCTTAQTVWNLIQLMYEKRTYTVCTNADLVDHMSDKKVLIQTCNTAFEAVKCQASGTNSVLQ